MINLNHELKMVGIADKYWQALLEGDKEKMDEYSKMLERESRKKA